MLNVIRNFSKNLKLINLQPKYKHKLIHDQLSLLNCKILLTIYIVKDYMTMFILKDKNINFKLKLYNKL
jgi:hypothetical protein